MRKYKVTDFEQFVNKQNTIEYLQTTNSQFSVWRDGTVIGIDKIRGQLLIQDYLEDDRKDWYSVYDTKSTGKQIVKFKFQKQVQTRTSNHVPWSEVTEVTFRQILDKEKHHNHVIIRDVDGLLRWKTNDTVREMMNTEINLNVLLLLLSSMGYDKNSEVVRKLYRDMGYSLRGYWEIFYWNLNNPAHHKYKPNTK